MHQGRMICKHLLQSMNCLKRLEFRRMNEKWLEENYRRDRHCTLLEELERFSVSENYCYRMRIY
ncbi:hypothetical protein ANCCAN_21443 [Ancylostoma caninum]|uniref:Uncharacterized protein n=1 Tax=Ancylostoma caninum TaxID=29170 RepID=A0A368FMJ6_ANCCA|nr:hypothetical protein ANCCAN_21443 [Ancylostoma caninum]